jgi:tRNA 2-selenouridine synthase
MAQIYTSLGSIIAHGFDTLIDVRSPDEFAEDHIPGAINLPVLSNEERAEVGTIYVQQSQFLARKIGAAMVFQNASAHIQGPLRDFHGGWRPLVYCWRGGQRSGSFGWMLSQIGWRSDVIEGGYKTYRRLVNKMLHVDPLDFRLILLDGYTGTAKTDILHHLDARGVQMLDLEGLAEHRGSLLGGTQVAQPSQKSFESRIAARLLELDPARPVLVEAESNKIGERLIPPSLWSAMKTAPRIEVIASLAERTTYLVRAYTDILSDTDRLSHQLGKLRETRGNAVVDGWGDLIATGDKMALTRALIEQHYDPAYQKSRNLHGAVRLAEVAIPSLDAFGLEKAVSNIEAVLARYDQVDASDI